jgi:hypothetical protein
MSSNMKTRTRHFLQNLASAILFGVLTLLAGAGAAQTTTSARGIVVDARTNEPLPFATVQFDGKQIGSTADAEGRFSLQIAEPVSRLKVTYMGYQTMLLDLTPGTANTNLEARLEEDAKTLKEVVVRNERYRNKDNPAVGLIRQVIENKSQNRREGLDFFSYEQYEKVEFALNNVDEKLRNGLLFRKMQFLFDNADTSASGAVSLPFYLFERLADVYYRKKPNDEKSFIKGEHSTSLPGFLDGQGVAGYVQNMYQNVDIYDNKINLATVEFISPLSPIAPNVYRFYIQDTIQMQETPVVRLYFAPRNKSDLAFEGNMWVALDGTYAVRRIELGVPKGINLNWVSDLVVEQEFNWVESTNGTLGTTRRLMLSQDRVLMNFGVTKDTASRSLIGHKTVSYRNYTLNQPLPEQLFKFSGNTRYVENPDQASEAYWEKNRDLALNTREAGIQKTIDTLNNYSPFKRAMSVARILFEGYHGVGVVDIGPVNTFYSFNPVEGFRGRLGGRTNPKFSRDLLLESYAAYGFKDERWKGYFGATYSFSNSAVRRFPLNQVRLWFQDEIQIPGQDLQFIQEDNFLLSFKRGVNDKMIYKRVFGAEYLKETASGFSYAFTFKSQRQLPAGALLFQYGSAERPDYLPEINTTEFTTHLRYAPNEKFYQGATYRTPILSRFPVFNLYYTYGGKNLLGGAYDFHSVQIKASKVFFMAPLGWSQVVAEAGRTFGTVPFPLLVAHRANQTYAYQLESYNLMNFLEFVSDKYASVNINHTFGGFFFNRVPLLRRLKWREMVSFKGLWGGLDDANRPTADNGLLHFPTNADGTPLTYALDKRPYMEASVGVGNIFKILRVDYVRRLSYLDHPNVTKWGIRARVKVEF